MPQNNSRTRCCAVGAILMAAITAAPFAHALSSDREKPMKVTAAYSKITQGNEKTPGVAYLKGSVQITQGSMQANGAEATIYQHPVGGKSGDSGSSVQRVVLIGQPAHMQQQQDKGGSMTADAARIDYDADSSIAVLTGNVTVMQQGSGTFNGEHMTYNTNTGEMESTDANTHKPVTMTFEPKPKTAIKDKPAASKKDGTPP